MKMMKLWMVLLFRESILNIFNSVLASFLLECDKGKITAHIEEEFILFCKYDTSQFLSNKKYWCQGDSRYSCKILSDSYSMTNTDKRHTLVDRGRRGLTVKVTNLRLADTGLYWIGIDRLYADFMTSVDVLITQVPVSKPTLWPLSLLMDKPTCWGEPVTVRCGSMKGSSVHYNWYQQNTHGGVLLQASPDLHLTCGPLERDNNYYCTASNDISSGTSDVLSVRVLMPGESGCIYIVDIQGQPIYDCADRLPSTSIESVTISQTTTDVSTDLTNQALSVSQTGTTLPFNRSWTEMPLWYRLLRWTPLVALIISVCILKGRKIKHKIWGEN